jgi:cytochrome c553
VLVQRFGLVNHDTVFGVRGISRPHQDSRTPNPTPKGFANPMLRSRIGMCASLAAAAIFSFAAPVYGQQAPAGAQQPGNAPQATDATPKPQAPVVNLEAPLENQRPNLPSWAFAPSPRRTTPVPPDDGTVLHIPGSDKGYTRTQINDSHAPPDWFPDKHLPAPKPVTEGNNPRYAACGECHLANGNGKPDTAALNGLPAAYIEQQMEDFRDDHRHESVPHMAATSMIPVAKGISPEESKEAAEYFASMKPVKWIRVVEGDTVPKTEFVGHRHVVIQGGGTEPIGNRVVEVPENETYTVMRDAESGFVAYVPTGSVKKGEVLVKTGGNGKTTACVMCHGQNLKGMGTIIPPIAGRSPSSQARQIYDFQSGARDGANAALMKAPVANLTDEDIVNITAYLASLDQ